MASFPPNTDSDIPSMVARWLSQYEPQVLEQLGMPASDLRALVDDRTELAQYQMLFDRYYDLITSQFQFTPEAIEGLRNRVRDPDTLAREGFDWWNSAIGGIIDKLQITGIYEGIIDGVQYYPQDFLIIAGKFLSHLTLKDRGFTDKAIDILNAAHDTVETATMSSGAQVFGGPMPMTAPFGPADQSGPFQLCWCVNCCNLDGSQIAEVNKFKLDPNYPVKYAPLVLIKFTADIYMPAQILVDGVWQVYKSDPGADYPLIYAYFETADPDSGIAVEPTGAQDAIVNSGFFKLKTEYLIIGDEPEGGVGVFDLKSALTPDDIKSIKTYFSIMPRSMLHDFFMKQIWPSIPWDMYSNGDDLPPSNRPFVTSDVYGDTHRKKTFEDMVWAGVIDLFNESNLEYCNANSIEPWDWENQKTNAYYISTTQGAIDNLSQDIDTYRDIALALDPKAQVIMKAFMELPKLGDLGMEINRQNAVKELLRQKDYVTAQAIVDAFRYAQDTVIGDVLTKPIPYDVQTSSGITVRAT